MKKVLAVVIAVAFISIGAASQAQVPNVQVYFDQNLQTTQGFCKGLGVEDNLPVVWVNFNTFIKTVEYAVDMGPNTPVTYLGAVYPDGSLHLGSPYVDGPGGATDGVTITYTIPQNGFDPFISNYLHVLWTCDTCGAEQQPITIVPHETAGTIQIVEFQTYNLIDGVGMRSLVCPGEVSTKEATWGQIKSLYNN